MHHIQLLRYLPILGFALLMMWLLATKWEFIKQILSDGQVGSATRTAGLILVLVVAFNEIYTTVRTQKFENYHLVAILISIGVLFGLVKAVDLFSIWKGGKLTPDNTDAPDKSSPENTAA